MVGRKQNHERMEAASCPKEDIYLLYKGLLFKEAARFKKKKKLSNSHLGFWTEFRIKMLVKRSWCESRKRFEMPQALPWHSPQFFPHCI